VARSKKEKKGGYDTVKVATSESIAKTHNERPAELSIVEIQGILDKYKGQIAAVVPKHVDADQMIAIAIMACQKEPKLRKCTWQSLSGSVLRCAQSGLIPDGEHAAIVPYWNSKLQSFEAQFQPMYTGLLRQAYQEEKIESVHAHEVRANDDFDVSFMPPSIKHKPAKSNRGDLIGAYGVVYLKDATNPTVEWLDLDDMKAIEKKSKSDAWTNHRHRMFKKSGLNAVLKYVPKSKELTMAIALGEMSEAGKPQHLAVEMDPSHVVPDEDTPQPPVNVTPQDSEGTQKPSQPDSDRLVPREGKKPEQPDSGERALTDEEKEAMGPPSGLSPEEKAELDAADKRSKDRAGQADGQDPQPAGDLLDKK
jgi:recombination protein RecT